MFQPILFISQLESALKSLIFILVANLTLHLDQLLVKIPRHSTVSQCYYFPNWYDRKGKFDQHLSCCVAMPGYVYNFNTQSLVTFNGNLKFKGDIPLTVFIDFDTTAPTDKCFLKKTLWPLFIDGVQLPRG